MTGVYKISPGFYLSKRNKNTYLYDAAQSQIFIFTDIAYIIINEIKKQTALEMIVKKITNQYEITHQKARFDTMVFIRSLIKKGVVVKG